MKTRTKLAIALALVLILAAIIRFATQDGGDVRRASTASATSATDGAPNAIGSSESDDASARLAPTSVASSGSAEANDANGAKVLVAAKWGSAKGQLGHERPSEGNPEGPMSFALANGKLVVLDQVNRRIVRYDERGNVVSDSEAPATVQDIAVARDGSAALLDRLSSKSITLVDPSGKKIGELSLERAKAGDPGLVTGVFVDGKDVYVEKEHGALVQIGTIDGRPADGAAELAGRPSRDGSLLLHATMAQGRVVVNAIDRKTSSLRFARAVPFARPLRAVLLLDSDTRGTIYLAASAGAPNEAEIVCLEPSEGRVIGRGTVTVSTVPEESFRDFSVGDDGAIVYAVRTDEGVTYASVRCP